MQGIQERMQAAEAAEGNIWSQDWKAVKKGPGLRLLENIFDQLMAKGLMLRVLSGLRPAGDAPATVP